MGDIFKTSVDVFTASHFLMIASVKQIVNHVHLNVSAIRQLSYDSTGLAHKKLVGISTVSSLQTVPSAFGKKVLSGQI